MKAPKVKAPNPRRSNVAPINVYKPSTPLYPIYQEAQKEPVGRMLVNSRSQHCGGNRAQRARRKAGFAAMYTHNSRLDRRLPALW